MAKRKTKRIKHVVTLPQDVVEGWFANVRHASERFIDAYPKVLECFLCGNIDEITSLRSDHINFRAQEIDSVSILSTYTSIPVSYVHPLTHYFDSSPLESIRPSDRNDRTLVFICAFGFGILRWAEVAPSPRLRKIAAQCRTIMKRIALENPTLLLKENGRSVDIDLSESVYTLEQLDAKLLDGDERLRLAQHNLNNIQNGVLGNLTMAHVMDAEEEIPSWLKAMCSDRFDLSDISFALRELSRRKGDDFLFPLPKPEGLLSNCGEFISECKDLPIYKGVGASLAAELVKDIFVDRKHFCILTPESVKDLVVPEIYTELRTRLLVFKHTVEIASLLPNDVGSELASSLSQMLADQLRHLTDVWRYEGNLFQLGLALEASSTALAYTKGLLDVRAYPLLKPKARMTYHNTGENTAECRIGKRILRLSGDLFHFVSSLVWYRSRTTKQLKGHVEKWGAVEKRVRRLRYGKASRFPELSYLIEAPVQGSQDEWTTEIMMACDGCDSPLPIKTSAIGEDRIFECKCGVRTKGIEDISAPKDIINNMKKV